MKKLLVLAASTMLLAACGGGSTPTPIVTSVEEKTSEVESEETSSSKESSAEDSKSSIEESSESKVESSQVSSETSVSVETLVFDDNGDHRIVGAGAFIYLDAKALGITIDNRADFTPTVSLLTQSGSEAGAPYATGGDAAITVNECHFQDYTADNVCLYVTMSAGIPDDGSWNFTHNFTIKIETKGKVFAGEISFFNNKYKTGEGETSSEESVQSSEEVSESSEEASVSSGTVIESSEETQESSNIGSIEALPLAASVKSKVIGAGAFIYLDSSVLPITADNQNDYPFDAKLTVECDTEAGKPYVSNNGINNSFYNFGESGAGYVCLYIIMKIGIPTDAGWEYYEHFDITVTHEGTAYQGRVSFLDNVLIEG
ncbi:MAG: hypothetical protein K5694_05215 [Bacilli bacterium]|nr:hypothetical protein [Bacilli bacterium]